MTQYESIKKHIDQIDAVEAVSAAQGDHIMVAYWRGHRQFLEHKLETMTVEEAGRIVSPQTTTEESQTI